VAEQESRESQWTRLGGEAFDLLVVGGGITGCGIARDAVLRGLKVGLVEKRDFGAGTSSRSSKLVHGGLRYLEQGALGLVFESVNEREKLMHLARHLVRPLPFLVTNYRGDRRWLATLDVGLWIYDALCLFKSYRTHRTFGKERTLELEPGLKPEGLKGSILYYDCQTDDARLTLENALDARALGAVVLNHARAGRLLTDAAGNIAGAEVTDALTGRTAEAHARVVVNATGPWTDEVRALAGEPGILTPTKGIHLVVDEARLPLKHALMMTSPRDQRVVFAIPFGLGRTVVGTTDTFFDGSPDALSPTRDDVEYLLETANAYAPGARLTAADVLATWCGLRPLLKPAEAGISASGVSREHLLLERPGFLTIAGGKLTTYRRMAAEVVDRAVAQLGLKVKSSTGGRPLPGAMGVEASEAAYAALVKSLGSGADGTVLDRQACEYFAGSYGTRAPRVLARTDDGARARLDPELPCTFAQVDEAVEVELARTVEDVLARRVPLLLRSRDQGLGVAQAVAERIGRKLGWSEAEVAAQVAGYQAEVAASRAFLEPSFRT
jgi:glycerol-3-phosphate dehydrogenase